MGKSYPNIYPQFAHDPACRCCHPNDRPYCPCPCHSAAPGEAVALRARWDSECRVPDGPPIARRPAPVPLPPRPAPRPMPRPADDAARRAALAGLPGRTAE